MTLSTFPTFLTFLTLSLVHAGWLKFVTTTTDGRAIHRWRTDPPAFFAGHQCQKGQKGQKGMRAMTLANFVTFLAFLTMGAP